MAGHNIKYPIVIVLAIVLLGGFFLPWVRWEDVLVSGYAMPSGGFFSVSAEKFGLDNPFPGLNILLVSFWLIPAAAILVLLLAVMKKNTSLPALLAGVMTLSLVTVYILFTRTLLMLGVGNSVLAAMQAGIYVSALAAIGLILSAVRAGLVAKILLVIAGPLLAWLGFLIIEKKTASEKYDDSSRVESAYTVWSQDLIREFRADEAAANQKYAEQILTVRGRISETEIVNDSTINIRMSDSTGSYVIFPFLPPYLEKARALKPGDSIEIRGSCSGGMYSEILEAQTISFKRCALIQ